MPCNPTCILSVISSRMQSEAIACGNANSQHNYLSDTMSCTFNYLFLIIRTFIVFNVGKFFKIIFSIFWLDSQNRDMTKLKLVWPDNMTCHCSKIILSSVLFTRTFMYICTHCVSELNGNLANWYMYVCVGCNA